MAIADAEDHTAEAEYYAASEMVVKIMYVRNLIKNIG
jgi:hypothetical protein